MMLLGTISFALLFLLFGRVTGVVPLVVLRLAHGVCLAMYLAASAAYIADYAPVDRRGRRRRKLHDQSSRNYQPGRRQQLDVGDSRQRIRI